MEERSKTLINAHFISVLNVLEKRLSKIPRPAHENRDTESGNIYQYFFMQPKRSEDKDKRWGRITADYSRTTIRSDGSIVVGEYTMKEKIIFECTQEQEGDKNTVEVKGQYPIQYSSTTWIKPIFDNILADLLKAFEEQSTSVETATVQGSTAEHQLPIKPKQDSSVDIWLDYYHAMKKAGYKMTFPMLQKESGYSYGTFKQAHGNYKRNRGID